MAAPINQKEYLKKYLSGGADTGKKKKKKKKDSAGDRGMRIIEEGIDLKSVPFGYQEYDDAPTVAEVTYEDTSMKVMEEFQASSKWKKLKKDMEEEEDDINKVEIVFGKQQQYDSDEKITTEGKRHDSDTSPAKRQRHDSDTSPARRQRHDSDTPPRRQRHDSDTSPHRHDSDTSPQRKQRNDSDISPSRKQRHDSDSSPRRQRHDSDTSPPKRQRHVSESYPARRQSDDSDASPLRIEINDSDNSPQIIQRHDSDTSPPRRQRNDSDASPPRRQRNDSDASPPRRKRNDSDASPPRRQRNDSDASPPRRQRNDSDESPPRRKRNNSDSSPPRRKIVKKSESPLLYQKHSSSDESPPRVKENPRVERTMTTSEFLTARKKGKLKKDTPEELARKERNASLQQAAVEKHQSWNKGVAQMVAYQQRLASDHHEMGKAFTRTADDKDMNDELKTVHRREDPMQEYLSKKTAKTSKAPVFPKYQGSFPPNRFNVRPGYRWDGVDRSTGFENQWFEKQCSAHANAEDAYKWSVSDM